MHFRSRERNCLVTFVLMNCRLLQLLLYWGVSLLGTACTIMSFLTQWRNYNFWPPANIRHGLTVLIHNSGHFGPPLPFWATGPPGIAGDADG